MSGLAHNLDFLCLALGAALALLVTSLGLWLRQDGPATEARALRLAGLLGVQILWLWTNALAAAASWGPLPWPWAAGGLTLWLGAAALACLRARNAPRVMPVWLEGLLCLTLALVGMALPLWPAEPLAIPAPWRGGLLVLATGLAFACAAPVTHRRHQSLSRCRPCLWHAATALALAGCLTATWRLAEHRSETTTQAVRQLLLEHAARLALSLDAEDFRNLSFTPADRENPRFERIRQHLRAFGQFTGSRCIYSLKSEGGQLIFGPEDLPERDPLASVPGDVYKHPPPELTKVFATGEGAVIGPYEDEFGAAISAYGIVRDMKGTPAVIGIDLDPAACLREAASRRLEPLGVAIVLCLLLPLVLACSELQTRAGAARLATLSRYLHTAFVFAVGVTAVVGAAGMLYQLEMAERKRAFDRLASAYEQSLLSELDHLYDGLGSVAQFMESNDQVSRGAFAAFTGRMLRSPSIQAYMWTPRVLPEQKEQVETAGRLSGRSDFRIYDRPGTIPPPWPNGQRLLFPNYYVRSNDRIPAVGMDMASEPVRRKAILEALRTGQLTASAPTRLMSGDFGLLLFRPVAGKAPAVGRPFDPARLDGVATCVLNAQAMLGWVLARVGEKEIAAELSLVDITDPEDPVILCSHPDVAGKMPLRPSYDAVHRLVQVNPISFAGRTLAVVTRPANGFFSDQPVRLHKSALLAGLPACLLAAAFIHRMRGRQIRLETLVQQRTQELQQSTEHLERIVRDLPAGVIIVDQQTQRIVDANPLASAMLGWERNELIGRDQQMITCVDSAAGQRPQHNEAILQDRNGNRIPVIMSVVPITVGGRPCHLQAFLDIRELHQLLNEQQVNIGLASQILQMVNRRTPRHIELTEDAELFIELASVPCKAAGGDHCLIRTFGGPDLSDRRTVVSLKDESGHEVNCVLRSVIADLLHHAAITAAPEKSLREHLTTLNEHLCSPGLLAEDDFLTTVTVEINHATRLMRYACCGHPPLLLIRGSQVHLLPEHSSYGKNPPIGALGDATFTVGQWQLEEGDRVLLYTDGLIEMPLAAGRPRISPMQLRELVSQIISQTPDLPVSRIVQQLLARVSQISGTRVVVGQKSPAADDVTLVGLEIEPAGRGEAKVLAPADAQELAEAIRHLHQQIMESPDAAPFAAASARLRLVLEEAVVNAWKHGNRETPYAPVTVRWRYGNDLVVEVMDSGEGFDTQRVRDPRTSQRRQDSGGRGVFLIKGMSDSARWKQGGRHMTACFASPLHPEERRRNGPGCLPVQWW